MTLWILMLTLNRPPKNRWHCRTEAALTARIRHELRWLRTVNRKYARRHKGDRR